MMIAQTTEITTSFLTEDTASFLILACVTMFVLIVVLMNQLLKKGNANPKKPIPKSNKVIASGSIKGAFKRQIKVPKKTKDSIPYKTIYKNGIVKLKDDSFSKAYILPDSNFTSVPESEQEMILTAFAEVLNLLPYKVRMQTVVFDKPRDNQIIENDILMKPQRDLFNELREEFNEKVLKIKLSEGNNNIETNKYLILTTKTDTMKEAFDIFSRVETDVNASLASVASGDLLPMTMKERLKGLYEIYNMNSPLIFGDKKTINGTTIKVEDIEWINRQGLTSKDSIGPTSFHFEPGYFIFDRGELNPVYGSVLYLKSTHTTIVPDITREISAIPCAKLISAHYETEREDKALKMLKNTLTFIKGNVAEEQRRLAKQNLSADMVSDELLLEQEQASEFLQMVMKNNQKVIYLRFVVAVFASSKEELDKYIENVKTAGTKYMCNIKVLTDVQEKGLNTALPLGYCEIDDLDTLQTTSSATAFHPFTSMEMLHKDGVWYGQNNTSKNLCMIDRRRGMNYHAVRIGKSGSGKSLSDKNEKSQMIMRYPNDSFYFIDPDGEYQPLCDKFMGQTVRLANGSSDHINPLDLELNSGDSIEEALALKIDFLQALCEIMVGAEMTAEATGIIDRCGRAIYKLYIEHIKTLAPKGITIDYQAMPTLKTFYEEIMELGDELATRFALAIEPFCVGTKDVFAYPTNVNIKSRVVVFNILGLGKGMLELGLHVCGDFIWNKGISNKQYAEKLRKGLITKEQLPVPFISENSMTWADIDEFHVLTKIDSVIKVFVDYWKRGRKFNICFTALSQNISDFMRTEDTKAILKNSSMLMIFNITSMDRQDVSEIVNLSESQIKYVKNPVPGRGLLCWEEKTIIELDAIYPEDCSLFEVIKSSNKNASA